MGKGSVMEGKSPQRSFFGKKEHGGIKERILPFFITTNFASLPVLPFHLFFFPPSCQRPVSCPITDLWLHLCPQTDTVGAVMVVGGRRLARDFQLPFENNKDDFPVLILGFVSRYQSYSAHFNTPTKPPAGRRQEGH